MANARMTNSYTLTIPAEIDHRLDEIAHETGHSKGEVMKFAFATLSLAQRRKKEGLSLGLIKPKSTGEDEFEVVSKIVGM